MDEEVNERGDIRGVKRKLLKDGKEGYDIRDQLLVATYLANLNIITIIKIGNAWMVKEIKGKL